MKKQKKSGVDKLAAYVDSLDFNAMWESFANSFNENGTPRYRTVWSFITKQTKDAKERDILYWMLGPRVEIEKGQKPKYSLEQYDWEDKRQKGFWFSSKNIENLKTDIHNKASAYESVRQAGRVNVDTIAMLNNLLRQLETEFGGRILLPNLTTKENMLRANLYMNLLERITKLSTDAQLMYAKSQGLDLENLDAFFQLFGAQMGKTAATLMGQKAELADKTNPLQAQFSKVVEMVTTKATEFSLPLPDNLAQAIKETSESKSSKKAKVN